MEAVKAVIEALDEYVARAMRREHTPGLALAVTDQDDLLHVATYGWGDLAARQPIAPETLFEIGSIGKSFTSIIALQLSDEGRLDLDAPVMRYLPWFEMPSRFGRITLHHLLSHTAGITAGLDGTPSAVAEVWALRETEAATPPGTRWHYSNVGYKALGLVLAKVLDQEYGQIVQERLLDPLGMTATAPIITHETRSRLAVGYVPLYDDRPAHPAHPLVPGTWLETNTGDGSIASTAADMAAYARLLLRRGEGPTGRLLSETGFARLTHPVAAVWGGPAQYGYGVTIQQIDGHTVVGHPGGMIGYESSLQADLDAGFGICVLVNGPRAPNAIARAALQGLRAAVAGGDPRGAMPDYVDPPEDLADYQGEFVDTGDANGPPVSVTVDGDRLRLRRADRETVLDLYDEDIFISPTPPFDRFSVQFEREASGGVTGFVHGPDVYRRPEDDIAPPATPRAEWQAFVGHYRSHNPWASNFRVILRRGTLWLIWPQAPDGFDDEQPLVPLTESEFRVGEDPDGPERIRFADIVDGQAIRAIVSACPYYRFFTP